MKLLTIQTGKPKTITVQGKEITTGIFKSQITGAIRVNKLNLEGDGQADLTVHGGADKAVYAYAQDVYAEWKALRPKDEFPNGAMGENLTFDKLFEDRIFVGDTFELGSAILQAVQPRFPCYKLGAKFNDPKILKQFMQLNRPGVYFRVLKEGLIDAGQTLKLLESPEAVKVSVQELFELKQNSDPDPDRIEEILKVKSLNAQWREKLGG